MVKRARRFPIGTRVQMSKLGAVRCPRSADKTGTVVGGGNLTNVVWVLFDGNRTATPLYRGYIKAVAYSQPKPAQEPPVSISPNDGIFLITRSELLERRRLRRKHHPPPGQPTSSI